MTKYPMTKERELREQSSTTERSSRIPDFGLRASFVIGYFVIRHSGSSFCKSCAGNARKTPA